jgi:Mn2+/Fe2+ NRAMP family transporter
MAIIAVGSEITEGWDKEAITGMVFNFKLVSSILELSIGDWAVYIFGFGLFAAGFTSAITSPLASALTASSIFKKENSEKWSLQSKNFKRIIYFVLAVGLTFGFLNVKPIPVIITAQALNGLILPFISIFLLFIINDLKIMGKIGVNGIFSNIFMTFTVWITLIIGLINIIKAILSVFKIKTPISNPAIIAIASSTLILSIFFLIIIYRKRKRYRKEEAIKISNSEN